MDDDEKNLSAQGAALVKTLRADFTDRIKGMETTAEEHGRILRQLQGSIEEMTVQLKSREHHGDAYVDGANDAFTTDDPARRFNLHRGLVGWHSDFDYDKTPYGEQANKELWPEREILMEATQKAQSAGVDTEGGFAVPEQFNSDFIPILLAKTVAGQLGVVFTDGFTGSPVVWPRIDAAAQAYWVAENVAPPESEAETGQISMTPHDLAALIPVSNRLLMQTSGRFETMLRDHMARIMALKLDLAIFKGIGAAGEPLGLSNTPGVGTTSWSGVTKSGASQTVTDKLSAMVEAVDTSNALEGNLGWVAHPQVHGFFRESKDADGRPLFMAGDPERPSQPFLHNYQILKTTQLASGATADLMFGNWADFMVGQWGTLILDSSSQAGNAFFRRQTYIRSVMTVDMAVMHEASFNVATAFNAAA